MLDFDNTISKLKVEVDRDELVKVYNELSASIKLIGDWLK